MIEHYLNYINNPVKNCGAFCKICRLPPAYLSRRLPRALFIALGVKHGVGGLGCFSTLPKQPCFLVDTLIIS